MRALTNGQSGTERGSHGGPRNKDSNLSVVMGGRGTRRGNQTQPNREGIKPVIQGTDNGRLLLRGGEVAEVLGISRALAYRWMQERKLPVVTITGSRSIRVPREALMEWIREQTQKSCA